MKMSQRCALSSNIDVACIVYFMNVNCSCWGFPLLQEMERKLAALNEATGPAPISLPCSLDKSTQALIRLIFDADMFNNALKSMDLGKWCESRCGM